MAPHVYAEWRLRMYMRSSGSACVCGVRGPTYSVPTLKEQELRRDLYLEHLRAASLDYVLVLDADIQLP